MARPLRAPGRPRRSAAAVPGCLGPAQHFARLLDLAALIGGLCPESVIRAGEAGVSRETVSKWRRRFLADRLMGLADYWNDVFDLAVDVGFGHADGGHLTPYTTYEGMAVVGPA
jgi:hypothetical protein